MDGREKHKETPCGKVSKRRLATPLSADSVWPRGIVCYDIKPTSVNAYGKFILDMQDYPEGVLSPEDRELTHDDKSIWEQRQEAPVQEAMSTYTVKTGVKFIHKDVCLKKHQAKDPELCGGCKNFVMIDFRVREVKQMDQCWSHVGYQADGDQEILLSPGCWSHHTILHELGHTIGLVHDHQRSDRAVVILRGYAEQSGVPLHNFAILPDVEQGGTYNIKSIMHYDGRSVVLPLPQYRNKRFCDVYETEWRDWCTIPQGIHIDTAPEVVRSIGRATSLTDIDVATVRELYRAQLASTSTP